MTKHYYFIQFHPELVLILLAYVHLNRWCLTEDGLIKARMSIEMFLLW